MKPKLDLLLDSGAFSARSRGVPVDLDEYCDYLLANQQWIGAYFNLDEINPDDPEDAARASFANYQHMLKRGLKPIPVFHAKEDISWLYRMLDAGAEYIGLAALSLGSHKYRTEWYANVWDKLTDSQGLPLIKAHALGEGRYDALSAFPWYSADSTSWLYSASRSGEVRLDAGRTLTMRKDGLNERGKPGLEFLTGLDAAEWKAFLDKHKVDPAIFAAKNAKAATGRVYLVLLFYLEQEARVTSLCPIKRRKSGLFANSSIKAESVPITELKYYSVLGSHHQAWAALAYANASRGLVSYWYIKNQPSIFHKLIDFANDPQQACSTMQPMKKHWDTLKEFVQK
jgi:hypothetical protein